MSAASKVPRGTARPLLFRGAMLEAIREGAKDRTRRILKEKNSVVVPGKFENLRLETGRVRRFKYLDSVISTRSSSDLRCRCTFASGRERVVTISSTVMPGDVFWTKTTYFIRRSSSELLLHVTAVDLMRVQDLTDEEALLEGVQFLPDEFRNHGRPRDWFARYWDELHGRGAWQRNDWTWSYQFVVLESAP